MGKVIYLETKNTGEATPLQTESFLSKYGIIFIPVAFAIGLALLLSEGVSVSPGRPTIDVG